MQRRPWDGGEQKLTHRQCTVAVSDQRAPQWPWSCAASLLGALPMPFQIGAASAPGALADAWQSPLRSSAREIGQRPLPWALRRRSCGVRCKSARSSAMVCSAVGAAAAASCPAAWRKK